MSVPFPLLLRWREKGPGALVEAAGGVDGVAGRMTVLELRCA